MIEMIEQGNNKKMVAGLFILFLFIGFIKSGSYNNLPKIAEYIKQSDLEAEDALTVDTIEKDFNATVWNYQNFIELNGFMARKLNMQGFYGNQGIYITDDKYIVSPYSYTTTDYEYEQTVAFQQFLETNGINLLYVNEPAKYVDDDLFRTEFSMESYSNRNADRFLGRIREAGVPTIDLRDNINKEQLDVLDLFYRTDHHWTTKAGLWATEIIAQGLNDYCGHNIDTSIYEQSNYEMTEMTECWLGEQGRKVGAACVGYDDYTEIKPHFETNYTFKGSDGTYEGTFSSFINEDVYNKKNDACNRSSWHYSYSQINCINNNVADGKILILGDSYEQVVEPFLSLGVHETDSLILRNYDNNFKLRDYILNNGYDTVIICYAQFMVGAHDNENNANYRMFTFE